MDERLRSAETADEIREEVEGRDAVEATGDETDPSSFYGDTHIYPVGGRALPPTGSTDDPSPLHGVDEDPRRAD